MENELQMADTQVDQNALTGPHCMEAMNRIANLPVVESTIQTASSIYEKIKDYNSVTQWTCATAEGAVCKAVDVGKPIAVPIVKSLEGPIKKVDGVLCSGLDYVETKVPAVKLPPSDIFCQIYVSTKDFVNKNVTPKVESAYSYVEPAVKNAYEKIEPAVQTAKTVVEPAVERAKQVVEPYVQPAMDKVQAMKDNMSQKLEDYVNKCSHNHPRGDLECEECQALGKRATEKNQ